MSSEQANLADEMPTKAISAKIPRPLHMKVKTMAILSNQSVSDLIEKALEEYVRTHQNAADFLMLTLGLGKLP